MGSRGKSYFVVLLIASMMLLVATSAHAKCGDGVCSNYVCLSLDCPAGESHEDCPEDCGTRENCYNGVLDVEETKIDCGGVCWTQAEEVCDGKDNNGDCSVDEGPYDAGSICDPTTWKPFCSNGVYDRRFELNVDCGYICKTNAAEICDGKDNDKDCQIDEDCGVPSGGSSSGVSPTQPVEAAPQPSQGLKPSCSDGVQNQGELAVDCGGLCVTNDTELCDNRDNDRDCLVDEGEACSSQRTDVEQPVTTPATLGTMSEVVPAQAPEAVKPLAEDETQPVLGTPIRLPAEKLAPEFAEEIPAVGDIASLTDREADAFIKQNDGADFVKQMRKLAEEKGIYVPKGESDAQFGRKYVRYFFKHQSELAAKFEGKEPTEDDFVDLLRQFSEETYPKPVQQQSFFSKVASFFKRLFS